MFAGKVHALLARRWGTRVKGRDWYDPVFFVSRDIPLDLHHLQARLRASGHWSGGILKITDVIGLIDDAVDTLDVDAACDEVSRFLVDRRSVDVWSKQFFRDITRRVRPV